MSEMHDNLGGTIMRRLITVLLSCGVIVGGALAFMTPADARRGGGGGGGFHRAGGYHGHMHRSVNVNRHAHVSRNVNMNRSVNANRNVNVNRNVHRNVNRTYAYRNGHRGYWRNGVWIAAPAVGYVASCAYEYNRWRATGSSYWRDRYNACRGY